MVTWNWDEQADSKGVVHQSVANTDNNDATILKQGYDYANFSEITPNPVACWPLHENSGSTAYDVRGSNNGTVNGATQGVDGLLGTSAYSFDGTDDGIDLSTWTPTGDNSYTVSLWINFDSLDFSSIDNQVFRTGTGSDEQMIEFFPRFDGTAGWNIDHWGNQDWQTSNVISVNEWTHVVLRYNSDNSIESVYQNANEVGSYTLSQNLNITTDNPSIGYNARISGRFLDGKIADVRIYDHALSPSEIQYLYQVVQGTSSWTSTKKTL